jgi:hypothetical protein
MMFTCPHCANIYAFVDEAEARRHSPWGSRGDVDGFTFICYVCFEEFWVGREKELKIESDPAVPRASRE